MARGSLDALECAVLALDLLAGQACNGGGRSQFPETASIARGMNTLNCATCGWGEPHAAQFRGFVGSQFSLRAMEPIPSIYKTCQKATRPTPTSWKVIIQTAGAHGPSKGPSEHSRSRASTFRLGACACRRSAHLAYRISACQVRGNHANTRTAGFHVHADRSRGCAAVTEAI